MSKMTRDERIAAGWVERWGLYDYGDGTWRDGETVWTSKPRRRWVAANHAEAASMAPRFVFGKQVTPRRFWTRKRPKPAPELKVGDEVLVRAKVLDIACRGDHPFVHVELPGGDNGWVQSKDIVRATKESK